MEATEKNTLTVVEYDADGVKIKLDPETVKNYLVRGNGAVTDQEVLFFIQTCRAQKLNPLAYGEVYLIKFGNEPAQLVIGKETYMKRAFRNPNYSGMKSGIVVQRGETIIQKEGTCLYPSETLIGGWCKVFHTLNEKETETFKEVSLTEYLKYNSKGVPQANWGTKPCTMIEKVAVSQAMRAAFPDDYQGLYTAEEFGYTDRDTRAYTPKKTKMYENLVKIEYERQCGRYKFPDDSMLDIRIFAYYGIPNSTPKKKRQGMVEGKIRPTKKPDFDNIAKIICDSLNGIAYKDDKMIVDGMFRKYYSEDPRVEVKIMIAGGK